MTEMGTVGYVSVGVGKMWRVGEIENLRQELQPPALGEPEAAEETGIQVEHPGPAQDVAATVAESNTCDLRERLRVEVWLTNSVAPEDLRVGEHLVGRLRIARRIQRSAGRAYGKRCAAGAAHDPVALPAAQE